MAGPGGLDQSFMTEEHVLKVLKGTTEQQAELMVQLNQWLAELQKLRSWIDDPASEVPYDRERLAQDLLLANQKVEDLRRLVWDQMTRSQRGAPPATVPKAAPPSLAPAAPPAGPPPSKACETAEEADIDLGDIPLDIDSFLPADHADLPQEAAATTDEVHEMAAAADSAEGYTAEDMSMQKPKKTQPHGQYRSLYVSNVPFWASANHMKPVFARFGEVKSIHVNYASPPVLSKYAFVNYEQPEDASMAFAAAAHGGLTLCPGGRAKARGARDSEPLRVSWAASNGKNRSRHRKNEENNWERDAENANGDAIAPSDAASTAPTASEPMPPPPAKGGAMRPAPAVPVQKHSASYKQNFLMHNVPMGQKGAGMMNGLGPEGYPPPPGPPPGKGGPDMMKGKDKGKGGPPPFGAHHDMMGMGKGAPHVPPVFPAGMDNGWDGWGHDTSSLRPDAPSFVPGGPGGPGYDEHAPPPGPPPPGKGAAPRNDQMQWFQHAFAEKPARPPMPGFGIGAPPPPPPPGGSGGWGAPAAGW